MRTAAEGARRALRTLTALAFVALAAGCAGSAAAGGGGGQPAAPASVPGFDTRTYPGDGVMQQWRETSPYRWVGYYLPAPCHPTSTWTGRRQALSAMGWGFAVLYLGEQDWSAVSNPPQGPGRTPADGRPRCTHGNLTAEQGASDGADASERASQEGFPSGTIVYLNVERVDSVSPALAAYVRGWITAVLEGGSVRPGLYVHLENATALSEAATAALVARGGAGAVPLWVAGPGDFRLDARPADSGVSNADVWQGLFNVRETWGGATLTIDANVARSPSPSG